MAGGASGRSRWPDPRTPNEVERRGDPARPLTRPPLLNPANIHVGAPSRVAECGAQADQAARHTSTNGYPVEARLRVRFLDVGLTSLTYPACNLKGAQTEFRHAAAS
jgi:hypothetical protein